MKRRHEFEGLAPEGFRIRMMEPGEGDALRRIDAAATQLLREAGYPALPDPPPDEFVRWLLGHEVFVAEARAGGEPVGFAAAADLPGLDGREGGGREADAASCYWLAGLATHPRNARQGVGSALLGAVLARAGWFFHRAVALSTFRSVPFNAPFYGRRGFLTVPRQDWPASFAARFEAERPPGVGTEERVVMVKWL